MAVAEAGVALIHLDALALARLMSAAVSKCDVS